MCQAHLIDLSRQVSPGQGQGGRLTLHQLCRPLKVIGVVIPDFQGAEQGIIVQPVCLIVAELHKSGLQIRARPAAEVAPNNFEQSVFERDDDVVIDGGRRE